jgi:hypothetical protein
MRFVGPIAAGETIMRPFVLAIILLIACFGSTASSQTTAFRAGVTRITVAAEEPFDVLIWYPTRAEETSWQIGPFGIPATRKRRQRPSSALRELRI